MPVDGPGHQFDDLNGDDNVQLTLATLLVTSACRSFSPCAGTRWPLDLTRDTSGRHREIDQVKKKETHQSMLGCGHQGEASWEAIKVKRTEMKVQFVRKWSKRTLEEMETV